MRRAWPLVLAISLLLAGTSTAVASNWGAIYAEPTSVSFQDDSLMSYQWDTNLSSRMRTASDRTLTGSYATTDLNILKFADGHRTDLNNQYALGSMPDPSYIGYHDCVYWVSFSKTRCRHGHIRYKNSNLGNTTYEWALACHETGHSVGLRHQGSLSQSTVRCMYNPVPSGDPYVGTHNVNHINGLY
ncbi:MAG TPA: hypothetical protein VFA46_13225 [Actinomycetes bacterium]|nr:hypothetical protein [Actinomycetes bacterium]